MGDITGMKTRRAVALAGLVLVAVSVDCTDRSSSASDASGCEAYLACLAETDTDLFETELELYGSDGSCFNGSNEDSCNTACMQKLEDIDSDAEACTPPPDPDAPPVPESGAVDCADFERGPTVGPGEPGATGFPETFCSPADSGEGVYKCCSDDPAALGGALPAYMGKDIPGDAPLFAGANNAFSKSGMCVKTSDIPTGSGLLEPAAANCPIPCNPTWGEDEIATVCGTSRVCCQTRELDPLDCVSDGAGGFRPVTGEDIGALTDWNPASHATHQDPAGIRSAEIANDDVQSDVFIDCISQLTVANQRGFCMALAPGQACPTQQPSYVDACSAM